MSWQTFKDNILRVANNPDGIQNIETIADLYANEYDAAIKRGFDTVNGTKVRSGDVETMKQFFLSALQKGLTTSSPYDLVGEMGAGVKAYWATAILGNDIIPVTPAIGAISNIAVTSNRATNTGVWQAPISQTQQSFELKPEERVEYQEKLDVSTRKYEQAVEEQKPIEASTHLDEINKYQSILDENEKYRIDVVVPLDNPNLLRTESSTNTEPLQSQQPTPAEDDFGFVFEQPSDNSNDNPFAGFYDVPADEIEPGGTINTTLAPLDGNREFGVTNTEEDFIRGTFNEGKPFVTGFRGGGGGIGGFGGGFSIPYVPFPSGFPANATLGEKAVAIALYDASIGVKEIPKESDTGHERILQMQKNGAGGGTGFPWCACAVTTWWQEAGAVIANHPNKAYVPTWVSWAVANNRFVDKRSGANPDFVPKPGDIIVYGWGSLTNDHGGFDHVGLVWKIENGTVWGVDGNFSAAVTTHIANPKTIRGYILI